MTNDDIFWFRFAVRSTELQPWVVEVGPNGATRPRSSKIMKLGGSAVRALAVVAATMGMALSMVIVELRTHGVAQHRSAAPRHRTSRVEAMGVCSKGRRLPD